VDQPSARRVFPAGFLWGTATAAHQVEGFMNNDWTVWEEAGKSKDRSGRACDHWNFERFRQDVALMKSLHLNAYRLSIEWSRIMPGPNEVDLAAIAKYRAMLELLKVEGFTVMATLHHFTNPTWFALGGGWKSASLVPFLRYVEIAGKAFGDLVDFWTTFNEPMGYIYLGWLAGLWPPGKKRQLFASARVAYRMTRAHNAAYRILRRVSPDTPVGLVHALICYEAPTNGLADRALAAAADFIGNQWFLGKTQNDFIGVNYYMHRRFSLASFVPPRIINLVSEKPRLTDFGWEVYPKGIYRVLKSLQRYGVPLYVTENGVADEKDALRADFIREHLEWTHRAIADGVDVRGYFHWSLLDNFEWAEGFSKRFGLFEVDFQTQERRLRPSALVYRDIAAENAIEY